MIGVLMDDTDPLVTVMKVEKAPQETYADIGGLDNQIQEIKVHHFNVPCQKKQSPDFYLKKYLFVNFIKQNYESKKGHHAYNQVIHHQVILCSFNTGRKPCKCMPMQV